LYTNSESYEDLKRRINETVEDHDDEEDDDDDKK